MASIGEKTYSNLCCNLDKDSVYAMVKLLRIASKNENRNNDRVRSLLYLSLKALDVPWWLYSSFDRKTDRRRNPSRKRKWESL